MSKMKNSENILKINVFIVDDHKLVRDGIQNLLHDTPNIEVVGCSGPDDSLLEMLKTSNTCILILDMFLPKFQGIYLAKEIKRELPDIEILFLSSNIDEDLIISAFEAGASGYLHKDTDREELIHAINLINNGDEYIGNSIKNNLSNNFVLKAKYGDKYSSSKISMLTKKELDVMKYLFQGLMNKEIAHEMDISIRTVESHKAKIMEKLELNSTIEIVKYVIKNKLVDF